MATAFTVVYAYNPNDLVQSFVTATSAARARCATLCHRVSKTMLDLAAPPNAPGKIWTMFMEQMREHFLPYDYLQLEVNILKRRMLQ